MNKFRLVVIVNMLLVLAGACDTAKSSDSAVIGIIERPDAVITEVIKINEVSDGIVESKVSDPAKNPTMTIMTSEDTTPTAMVKSTVTIGPVIVEATILPLPTNTLEATEVNGQDTDQNGLESVGEIELGIGGLVLDLESWATKEIGQFYTTSHIEVSTLEYVSKFRSRAGHDYSDSFEKCASLKHYFHPLDFYEVSLSTPIYAASDGAVVWVQKLTGSFADEWKTNYVEVTGEQWPENIEDYQIFQRPDAAPNVWIRYHHVMPVDAILDEIAVVETRAMMMDMARPKLPGYRVNAGDLIAYGLGEISIEQHLDGSGIPSPCISAYERSERGYLPGCSKTQKFLSIFDHMTDEVFAEYKKLADVERSEFKVTKEELAMHPYTCVGEKFDNKGDITDANTYVLLQGIRGDPKSNVIEDDIESANDLVEIITSFEGNGDGQHGPFDSIDGDVIMITSDGGPLSLTVLKHVPPSELGSTRPNDQSDNRIIYTRPEGNASLVYETITPFGGLVSVSVTASSGVVWDVVVFRAN